MQIETYIDAAFAAHDDSKSHSGVAIFVAGVLVYALSRKQKYMTKSPTESELVALTDNLHLAELFHEFVEFITPGTVNTHHLSRLYCSCAARHYRRWNYPHKTFKSTHEYG